MPDLREILQTSLGSQYTIERELGGGGMSRVFVATETRLRRTVVIKVLTRESAADFSAKRFEREIQLAAGLQEPHIVPLLNVGTAGDENGMVPYYTMPFVEGESLRMRMRTCPVALGDAMTMLRDIATALSYAHEHGVVHRDIKPENVLLSGRTAVVTDFGIAKAISAAKTNTRNDGDTAGDDTLTQAGVSVGTPAYMSPEQATGGSVDARTDIYAWGVIAYELLAGSHPFAGLSAHKLIVAHLTEEPRPIREVDETIPPALASLVMRALEKDPDNRPQSANELLRVLDDRSLLSATQASPVASSTSIPKARRGQKLTIIAGIALLVLVVLLAQHGRIAAILHGRAAGADNVAAASGGEAMSGEPRAIRLAVLPFDNLGDTANAYFAEGVGDEVRGKLTALPGLAVIARTSSVAYRGSRKQPRQIARELGVHYLLTGTVRWAKQANGESRVQVNPELVEVTDSGAPTSRWEQPFDASLTDVFKVQTDIATQVANALGVELGVGARQELAERPTSNLEAYNAFLRGESVSNGMTAFDPPTLRQALAYYHRATALDPAFGLAWARVAEANANIYAFSVPTAALAVATDSAVAHAHRLAPDAPETHHAVGLYSFYIRNDEKRALAEYEAGLRADPSNTPLLSALATIQQATGHTPDALVTISRAESLDPRSAQVARDLGYILLFLREYPKAQAAFDRSMALAPTDLGVLEGRAMVELARGDLPAARAVIAATPRNIDRDALIVFLSVYADLYWVLTDAQQARLLQLTPAAYDGDRASWGMARAETYWLRGDTVRARAYADSARIALVDQLKVNPQDPQRHAILGVALAYLGRPDEAVREGERGVALQPRMLIVLAPYVQQLLVRIYLLTGQKDKALDSLEPLLRTPYFLSSGWLRIDPTFAPLKGNPRFERLANAQ